MYLLVVSSFIICLYLIVRDPVVVNVSYFFHFADDGTLPPQQNEWSLGVNRAASILYSAAEFRKQICSGSFPHVAIGRKEPKTPLCSVAYKYMFNSCRIPHREQDSYRMYDPSRYQHCVVACKGSFFTFNFMDDNGEPLPLSMIEERLYKCVELAEEDLNSPKIGWFTSNDRDSWADARTELLRVGGDEMNKALEKLESGALMICLDDEVSFVFKYWTHSFILNLIVMYSKKDVINS
jgi:carnitine O-acetyltransferase